MSKSLKRVKAALDQLGLKSEVFETGLAKTAQQAADEMNCTVDQIAKSIIMAGSDSGALYLFITAGAQHVDLEKAAILAGEPLVKADAATIRAVTGFAIGGVSPVGHLNPITCYWDDTLSGFDVIYAAAGTPNHVFSCAPGSLQKAIGARCGGFIR